MIYSAKSEEQMAIRWGSALFSKMKKQYWDLPHVKDKPLIFAIADFHDNQSMLWSSTSRINYLYGIKQEHHFDKEGSLEIRSISADALIVENGIEIPSGFFSQPGAENISAVLMSSCGTLSKFNRMGRQCGFGGSNIQMVRIGQYYNPEPNATKPLKFIYVTVERQQMRVGVKDWNCFIILMRCALFLMITFQTLRVIGLKTGRL